MTRKSVPTAVKLGPITDAKTIAEFVATANRDFDLYLPESWPPDTVAADIWALEITVAEDPERGSYTATAKIKYPNLGKGDAKFEGRVSAVLTRTGNFYLPNMLGDDPLTPENIDDLLKEN